MLSGDSRSSSPPITVSTALFPTNDRRRHSVTTSNASDIKSTAVDQLPLKNLQNQVTFEVKTSTVSRKVQVKTRHEESICTTNKTNAAVESILADDAQTLLPSNSSNSNNFVQSVRVSVSSSPNESQFLQNSKRQLPICSLLQTKPNRENYDESANIDKKEENLNNRPLLDLLNEHGQHKQHVPDLDDQTMPSLSSTSTSRILPAKKFSLFKPVIVHRKHQEPIDSFDLADKNEESTSTSNVSFNRRSSRGGVMRSHTFTTPTDIDTDSNQISSVVSTAFQSTPDLNISNQSNPSSADRNSQLSSSASSLIGTSNTNATPTSTGTVDDKNEAKRKAIASQMYDTEKSYVEALKNLVTKYYLPMKDKAIVSSDLINDIFYKIPEIHIHHTAFSLSLLQKLTQWDKKQTVGDLLLQMFTRTSVIETYTSFVNNYKTAQVAIRLCRDFSSFNKFLEQQARDHHGRLTLIDLIIQPVQRIPRYELYIKDFLKCTNINHPDYQLLLKAQSEVHSLAEQIDQAQIEVGSAELNVTNNSLEVVQDMIEDLKDLVTNDRYYIRHDLVTLQSSSGLKKDRCIFLFNDLIVITICKRRSGNQSKKSINSVIVNSPSGKQFIDNVKHKLIMKTSLERVNLGADQLKKTKSSVSTPPSLQKSHSTASNTLDKHRHLEEDALILGQMTDLAKSITIPHQQLDELLKETLNLVNKKLADEAINNQRASPESIITSDHVQHKSNNIQLIINTAECTETIDVIFSSHDDKIAWEKNFLEAKKILFETAAGQRNISFQHALTLPRTRPGSQFSCSTIRSCSNDICICYNDGDICLVDFESDLTLKNSNRIASSGINCIGYIPSNKSRRVINNVKQDHRQQNDSFTPQSNLDNYQKTTMIDSLFEIDSSDDDDDDDNNNNNNNNNKDDNINYDDTSSLHDSSVANASNANVDNEQNNTPQATIWLGTQNGCLFIYECSQTMRMIGRKNRICVQLHSSIHSIVYMDNKVFLALNHGQLCVFNRDIDGRWNLDNPIIRPIEGDSSKLESGHHEFQNEENSDPISVMTLVAGRLWCAIRDRIFVLCPNSLNVEHSFIADDCHRHVSNIAAGGSSIHHVWITSQGSHEIRLYHATHFVCLLETSIRTTTLQKLQACDDIIRAHKLGCLHITTLHICKDTLWIGTSAGIIINLTISQLVDSLSASGNNKITSNSIQLKGLPFGHAGPVRFIISTERNCTSPTEEGVTVKTVAMTIGDGFEDYNTNDETLGKDDTVSHLILWQL